MIFCLIFRSLIFMFTSFPFLNQSNKKRTNLRSVILSIFLEIAEIFSFFVESFVFSLRSGIFFALS